MTYSSSCATELTLLDKEYIVSFISDINNSFQNLNNNANGIFSGNVMYTNQLTGQHNDDAPVTLEKLEISYSHSQDTKGMDWNTNSFIADDGVFSQFNQDELAVSSTLECIFHHDV